MIIKYEVPNLWSPEIIRTEVERETETSVWVSGHRRAKHTTNGGFFETFDEAMACLELEAERKQARADYAMEHAALFAQKVKAIREDSA